MPSPARLAAFVVACLLFGTLALAQQAPTRDDVTEAQRQRDAGNLGKAAAILRAHLAQWPDDGEAARLLARTLYWMKDIPAARSAYQTALARHPDDTTLILQYATMLAETGERERARQMVLPLERLPATRAEARALLGSIAYWSGDLTLAKELLTRALEENPGQRDARRTLDEILVATSPWVRLSSGFRHDDQPLDRAAVGIDARWFATPLVPVTVHVEPSGYWSNGGGTQKVAIADVTLAGYSPSTRLEGEVSAGTVYRWYRRSGRRLAGACDGGRAADAGVHASRTGRAGPVPSIPRRACRPAS